jgi:hypothetical protein
VGRALWLRFLRLLKLRELIALPEPRAPKHEATTLGLRPGDLVRVRPAEEIAATLDDGAKTRGLSFDPEMVPYCGATFRVRDRIERFIEDKTGQMVTLSSDCVILDGAVCTSEHSMWAYLFCPRGVYPFWREAWLARVESDSGQPAAGGAEPSLSARAGDQGRMPRETGV